MSRNRVGVKSVFFGIKGTKKSYGFELSLLIGLTISTLDLCTGLDGTAFAAVLKGTQLAVDVLAHWLAYWISTLLPKNILRAANEPVAKFPLTLKKTGALWKLLVVTVVR